MVTAIEYDRDELVDVLRKNSSSYIEQFFRPEQDLYSLIRDSVAGNTFRAFHNGSQPPSKVFRHWATSRLTDDWFAQLTKADTQQGYDKLIDALTDELSRYWRSETGRPLAFGQGRKLRNLLMKHVARWSNVSATDRKRLIGFLHVPLDEFSLIAVRQIAATGNFGPKIKIPTKPSMSFAKTPELYNQLQGLMQGVGALAEVPPISIDLVAWNLAHDKHSPAVGRNHSQMTERGVAHGLDC